MKHNWTLPSMIVMTMVIILCVILVRNTGGDLNTQADFTPPPFERTADNGIPVVDTSLGWSQIAQDGMNFSAHICGNIVVIKHSADVYFTNDDENTIWLKLRIVNELNEVLGETGILKPGEYVKSVKFNKVPLNGEKIKLKIMAYQPETYYSEGAVTLNTTATIGE